MARNNKGETALSLLKSVAQDQITTMVEPYNRWHTEIVQKLAFILQCDCPTHFLKSLNFTIYRDQKKNIMLDVVFVLDEL